MPKKNPYLSQYKENISSQQRLIRQRLVGQETGEPGAEPPASSELKLQRLQTTLRSLPTFDNHADDIPSIDGEHIQDNDNDDERQRSHARHRDRAEREAEESLQFFKKNLLPTSQSRPATRPAEAPLVQSTTLKSSPRETDFGHTQQQQRSTGSLFDRQPSLSSVVKDESAYTAHSRAPLGAGAQRTQTATGPTATLTRPRGEQAALFARTVRDPRPSPLFAPGLAAAATATPNATATANATVTSASRRAQAGERPRQPSPAGARTTSVGETRPADELELARAGLSSLALRKSPAPRLPESPIPAEAFSRKPLNNSLLRAHDSIRLKVNRPKVRSTSLDQDEERLDGGGGAQQQQQQQGSRRAKPDDTELDDDFELPEVRELTGERTANERAVDVKRRSSRKNKSGSKGSKKNKKEGGGEADASEDPVPVRNFSEVRVVKVVRSEEERSLGVSLEVEAGRIVVARVFAGGLADKQGALQVGDIILAVNNREVYLPEQMQEQLRQSIMDDTVLLKIVPSFREELPTLCIYLRALFDYDPNEDSLSPCKIKGVAFNRGDILEVINQEDNNYWQARRVDSDNLETGLIPSQELEERRRAFVLPDYDLATKFSMCGTKVSRKLGQKVFYNVGQNCDFDKADLQLYEEVCRTPAFERRTLVLIGANGVGKQALKARLINTDPDRFGTPLPHTSRLPRDGEEDGVHYHFVTREAMEENIIVGKYLEYGEYDGALYGTKLDSVRAIIGSGRICVLDCSPTCLKVLKTSDYLPFVAFIAAPTMDQLRYMQDWNRGNNSSSINNNNNKTYSTFDRALSRQSRRAKTLQDFAFDFFEDEDLQVTVEESARLFRIYENYFDIVLVNDDLNRTFEQLRDAMDALSQAPQWIPISWIYGQG